MIQFQVPVGWYLRAARPRCHSANHFPYLEPEHALSRTAERTRRSRFRGSIRERRRECDDAIAHVIVSLTKDCEPPTSNSDFIDLTSATAARVSTGQDRPVTPITRTTPEL